MKQKHRKRRQPGIGRPGTLEGPQSLDDICQMVQRGELHLTVRPTRGKESVFGGRFDGQPLPLSFYLTYQAHEQELIDLVKRNDVRVCIDPASPVHRESYRTDESGAWCHACKTYREVSDVLRQSENALVQDC